MADQIIINRAVVQQALDVLEQLQGGCTDSNDGTVEAITVWCPEVIEDLRAALAQAEPVLQTCNCRWNGDVQTQQCTLHESHVAAIHEWAERAKAAEKKLAALAQAEPVQRKPLTDEEIDGIMQNIGLRCADDGNERMSNHAEWERRERRRIARAIEAAHGIGGQDAQV